MKKLFLCLKPSFRALLSCQTEGIHYVLPVKFNDSVAKCRYCTVMNIGSNKRGASDTTSNQEGALWLRSSGKNKPFKGSKLCLCV